MIEFRALGAVELTGADGRALQPILVQPKRLALLAYLAIAYPPQFRRRDIVVAYFWPELDANHARAALRQSVHHLRRSLGDAVTSRGDEELGIDPAAVWCDATAFDRACDEGCASRALELYRGNLLDGLYVSGVAPEFERWLDAERERLRRRASDAAWLIADREVTAGRTIGVTAIAQHAASLAPDDEASVQRLITLLDRVGDRAGAVRAYDTFASRLLAEYEVEPSRQTKALIESVRSVAGRPSAVAGGSLDDLYAIERELGRTATARVYLARERKHDRLVTLKVLARSLAAVLGPERFLREIHLLARLQHPRILPVHDSGVVGDTLYYAMPYLGGESLRDRLLRERRLALADAVSITNDVAEALTYAHHHGVVVRDLKPEGIALVDGRAVMSDFGIARAMGQAAGDRLTAVGVVLGTPAYLSPEQAGAADDVDERSDVYGLGCVVYEMLAGDPPFSGPTAMSIISQHLTAALPRLAPRVDAGVDTVLRTATAKAPRNRYATVALFADALREAARA